ncbi:hypothetical protein ACHAXT_007797 [Thalassiosira profunda]
MASHSFASPFKRVCRDESSSPFASFFAEARPATIATSSRTETVTIVPGHLQHPLSIARATPTVEGAKES